MQRKTKFCVQVHYVMENICINKNMTDLTDVNLAPSGPLFSPLGIWDSAPMVNCAFASMLNDVEVLFGALQSPTKY